jgi:hypothetical protein
MLYEFEEPFVVDHSDFERAFGMSATPLRQAIGETVRWYRRVDGDRFLAFSSLRRASIPLQSAVTSRR